MGKTLIDTNIFIDIFKGNKDLEDSLFSLESSINTIVYVELIQGSKTRREVRSIERYLEQFEIIPLDPSISLVTVELIRSYSGSHGLRLADAFIAATSIVKDRPLLTFKRSDFDFISNLNFAALTKL